MTAPVIEVDGLKKHFPIRTGLLRRLVGQVHAVKDTPAGRPTMGIRTSWPGLAPQGRPALRVRLAQQRPQRVPQALAKRRDPDRHTAAWRWPA